LISYSYLKWIFNIAFHYFKNQSGQHIEALTIADSYKQNNIINFLLYRFTWDLISSLFKSKVREKTRLCSLASFLIQVYIMSSVLNFMPSNSFIIFFKKWVLKKFFLMWINNNWVNYELIVRNAYTYSNARTPVILV
jgi:hypothetical protein